MRTFLSLSLSVATRAGTAYPASVPNLASDLAAASRTSGFLSVEQLLARGRYVRALAHREDARSKRLQGWASRVNPRTIEPAGLFYSRRISAAKARGSR